VRGGRLSEGIPNGVVVTAVVVVVAAFEIERRMSNAQRSMQVPNTEGTDDKQE